MSQSSREYVVDLHKFYSLCLPKGIARIRRTESDLLTIDGNRDNELPSIFQIPIAIPLECGKKKLWVFPSLANSNKQKLESIMNRWDNYLVCITSKRNKCKISLVNYLNKVVYKTTIKLYTVKT